MRIGVVSDTHGNKGFLADLLKTVGDLDLLVHAGDGANDLQQLASVRQGVCTSTSVRTSIRARAHFHAHAHADVHAHGDGWDYRALTFKAVKGNCDLFGFSSVTGRGLPQELFFSVEGWEIFLTHGHAYGVKSGVGRICARGRELGADLVIFGHTHLPLLEYDGEMILFNPGSLSYARCYHQPSFGLIEITRKKISPEIVYLKPENSS